ncbi:hypothetical protein [Curtobacterium sp. MCBD17_021]|uniref:hypothetical protein n=1 Tax=Curtobacterium sp. MCBD17_021 TaxID=2175665 RepID=UPI0011B7E156|nr:hypothetical protein [Curtobacterium sp. MCBD17_021]
MEPWEQIDLCWRAATPSDAFWEWVADRSAMTHDHLVGIAEVGRDETGSLVVHASAAVGLPLPAALDRIGSPTPGVAVTLTLPLVQLARLADSGAVLLGTARVEDVLVDDAGAVVLVDRPPGADGTVPAGSVSGAEALVLAVRAVWDRVDPRGTGVAGPGLVGIDDRCSAARTQGGAALVDLERVVRAAAPPRPVRWDPPPLTFAFDPDRGASTTSGRVRGRSADDPFVRVFVGCRELVSSGVPFGRRRIGIRPLATAVVVTVGLVVAAVGALGDDRAADVAGALLPGDVPGRTATAPPPMGETGPPG